MSDGWMLKNGVAKELSCVTAKYAKNIYSPLSSNDNVIKGFLFATMSYHDLVNQPQINLCAFALIKS